MVDLSDRGITRLGCTSESYQAKATYLNRAVGPHAKPTLVLSKKVPPGTYLVHAEVGVNVVPQGFLVCAVSNVVNGNDGVFGTYFNSATQAEAVNVIEEESVTVATGQSIHLMCDDNSNLSGNTIGEATIDALPVAALK